MSAESLLSSVFTAPEGDYVLRHTIAIEQDQQLSTVGTHISVISLKSPTRSSVDLKSKGRFVQVPNGPRF